MSLSQPAHKLYVHPPVYLRVGQPAKYRCIRGSLVPLRSGKAGTSWRRGGRALATPDCAEPNAAAGHGKSLDKKQTCG